jgi:hypothetical protein
MTTAEPTHALDPFWYVEFDTSSPLLSLFTTAARVVARPSRFFARLDPEGGYLTALAFGLLCTYVMVLLDNTIGELLLARIESRPVATASMLGDIVRAAAYWTIFQVVLSPLGIAFYHLFVRVFIGDGNQGYRATYRVLFYADSPLLWIGWIPVVGLIGGSVWATYLAIVGMREVHRTSTAKAAAAMLVPSAAVYLPIGVLVFWGLSLLPQLRAP